MKDKEKAGVAFAVVGSFILGWILHRQRNAGIVLSNLQISTPGPVFNGAGVSASAYAGEEVTITADAQNTSQDLTQAEIVCQVGDTVLAQTVILGPSGIQTLSWSYTMTPTGTLGQHNISVSVGPLRGTIMERFAG
ncbi:MAG: hypothetical protein PHI12_08200 [Dehalococcoidales bacterium]|nr:hypothetical protein [Dehalococcoidales bacterium]